MIIAVMPDIQRALGISSGRAGLLTTALSTPTALFLPVAGVLSDRYGRKTVMVPGVILYGLGGAISGLFAVLGRRPYLGIIIGRIIQGIGAAGMTLVAMSLAADMFQGEDRIRVLGILEASNSAGKLVSPLIGTLALTWAWYGPFWVYPILSAVVALALIIGIDGPHVSGAQGSMGVYGQQLCLAIQENTIALVGTYLLALITIVLWFGGLFVSSQRLDHARVFGTTRGMLLAVPVLVLIATDLWATRCGKEAWFPKFIGIGLVGMAVGQWGIGHTGNPYLVILALCFSALAMGLVMPVLNSIITTTVAEGQRGAVTTTYGSLRSLGSALGPPLFGTLCEGFGSWPFIGAASLAIVAAVGGYLWLRRSDGDVFKA
ncbi:MAG: MFS transporter [Firmicutes bacterium]|nr:MFS transporter [Bacillota bacterium]